MATDTKPAGGGVGGTKANTGDLRFCCANALAGDTIVFDPSLSGQTINLQAQIKITRQCPINQITIDGTGDIKGTGSNVTISGQTKSRLFEIAAGNVTSIDGLLLTGGNGNGGNGGAILVDSTGELTLNSDTFSNNKATAANANGGAIENDGITQVYGCIFNLNSAANNGGAIENKNQLTVNQTLGGSHSTFTNNKATNGGAIDSNDNGQGRLTVSYSDFNSDQASASGGAISTNDGGTLQDETFGKSGVNTAGGTGGGAVYAVPGVATAQVILNASYCTFQGNQANGINSYGGGIYTTIKTSVDHSTFSSNQAQLDGGGIDAFFVNGNSPPIAQSSSLTLTDDEFDGNKSLGGNGGGVNSVNTNNDGSYTVTVSYDTFDNNSAIEGGGLYLLGNATVPQQIGLSSGSNPYLQTEVGVVEATLLNDTFFVNSASDKGGGFYMKLSNNTGNANNFSLSLTNFTVNQNTAANDGGGGYVTGTLPNATIPVDNSIFSGNFVTAGGFKGTIDFTIPLAMLKDVGWNMVGTSEGALFKAATDISIDNPGLANTLALNGAPAGTTLTLALLTTSKGYQKGDPGQGGQPDQRHFTRKAVTSIGAEDPDAQ